MAGNYGALRSAEKFGAFVDRLIAAGTAFGFDIETGYVGPARDSLSLRPMHPDWRLVGFSFTNSPDWARYVPIGHDNGDNVDDVRQAARGLWRLLQTGLGVAHNLSFELRCLSLWFMRMLGDDPLLGNQVRDAHGMFPFLSDSMVEAFLTANYHPLTVGQDLKSLVKHIYGHQMIQYAELFEDKKVPLKKTRFNVLELTPKVIDYACEDSVWCLRLHKHPDHYAALKNNLVYKTEMALIPIWVSMEHEGMFLDWAQVSAKADEVNAFGKKMDEEIQKNLSDRLGEVININLSSPAQLGEVLFNRLGLPVKTRSEKTGQASTSEKALGAIAKADPVVKRILEYREVVKLYGSYLHKYESELNYAGNGRAYPNHKSTGAGTGRASVDDVSYQQWPKPYHYELDEGSTFDLNFRNLLISPEGWRGIGFDYSQVELRVLAGVSNETAMLHAFETGVDIHRATAATMMKIPLEEVDKKKRATGKTLNFATVYGSGPDNIADMLTMPDAPVTKDDAIKMLEDYFAAFPNLKRWMDQKVVEGRQQGYVHNLFGRKFTVWEYQDHRDWIRSKGDRLCVNAPIQGGAADYCKIAMVRAAKAIAKAEAEGKIPARSVRLFMMVHDALEFYVREDVDTQTVLDILGPAVSYTVPALPVIRADWHEFKRWGETVEIKQDETGTIVGYGIEDVDETFASVTDAYAYYAAQNASAEPAAATESDEAAVQGTQEPEAPQRAVVTIAAMPDENQWDLFRRFMAEHAGPGSLMLVTPEGAVDFENVRLTASDQPKVSALLGGATLTFADLASLDSMLEEASLR